MTAMDRFERDLPASLEGLAAPHTPDYLTDILGLTAATSQRPAWTFPERWLPMGEIAQHRAYFPSVPWRPILVTALLIALAAAALLVVGSQQRVPPPFGPARNGALAYGNGDIYLRDSIDGAPRLVIGGPAFDFAAGFTRDGERLTFLRRTAGTEGSTDERLQMFVADRDGSNVIAVTPPLEAPDWADTAPDSQSVVYITGNPAAQSLYVADLRQPGEPRKLDLGDAPMSASFPNFLGPAGTEVVFRGRVPGSLGGHSGIFAIHPDGTGLRPITPTDGNPNDGYLFPQPSPDGRYIAYTAWDPVLEGLRIHLVDLRTGDDRIVTDVSRSDGFATFSPDSQRIVYVSYLPGRNQIWAGKVDGSEPPLPMGPNYVQKDEQFVSGIFSPDGQSVLVSDPVSQESRLIDVATGGDGQVIPWAAADISGWQRLAP